jgi:hypothetical protein
MTECSARFLADRPFRPISRFPGDAAGNGVEAQRRGQVAIELKRCQPVPLRRRLRWPFAAELGDVLVEPAPEQHADTAVRPRVGTDRRLPQRGGSHGDGRGRRRRCSARDAVARHTRRHVQCGARDFDRSPSPIPMQSAFSSAVTIVLLLLASGPRHLCGQPRHEVSGSVRDAASGETVPAAWLEVRSVSIRVATDSRGEFTLMLPEGVHVLSIHALGYVSADTSIAVPAFESLIIALDAQPVSAGTIQVSVTRQLTRRRHAAAWTVRAIARADMASASTPTTAAALQTAMQLIPCGGGDCVSIRGSLVEPTVCIDERLAPGGLAELRSYPVESWHAIEVSDRGALIRAYTTWFMDRVLEGQVRLRPFIFRDRC